MKRPVLLIEWAVSGNEVRECVTRTQQAHDLMLVLTDVAAGCRRGCQTFPGLAQSEQLRREGKEMGWGLTLVVKNWGGIALLVLVHSTPPRSFSA